MDESAVRGSTVQIITDVETLYQYQVAEPLLDLLTNPVERI
jgi:hypothetical protein